MTRTALKSGWVMISGVWTQAIKHLTDDNPQAQAVYVNGNLSARPCVPVTGVTLLSTRGKNHFAAPTVKM